MKPDFRLECEGADITARLRDRLLELRVIDEAGVASDRLEITLDDRDHLIPLPASNAELKVWLGYQPPGPTPAYMGSYKVDDIGLSSGPRSVSIRAKAAELAGGYREPKTRDWHGKTIGDIVAKIAAEHGFTPLVSASLAGINAGHVDQAEESDAGLLTRLAGMYDAVAKPADGKLLFVKRGEGAVDATSDTGSSSASGSRIALRPTDVTRWSVTLSERGAYAAVTARYQDHATGETKSVTVGGGGDGERYQERAPYTSKDVAERAAAARHADLTRGKVSGSIELPGNPAIYAECVIVLDGFREQVNGEYSGKTVTHSYTSSGYTTSVEFETRMQSEGNDQ